MQVQSRVARTTVARMNAGIIATDRITVGLDSKQKQKSRPGRLGAALRSLPGAIDVVVFVNRRGRTNENEFVRVPSVTERRNGAPAQLLARRGKPALRALPGGKRAIELVRPAAFRRWR